MTHGLSLARRIGQIFGGALISVMLFMLWRGVNQHSFSDVFQGIFFGILGGLYLLPWLRLNSGLWRKCFGLLLVLTAIIAFAQIIEVMLAFSEAAEQGIKPAPPILRGIVLFLVMLQPAVIFFERNPEKWE